MKWRVIRNKWNLQSRPWRDAIGIEVDGDDSVVPPIVCWFCRGTDPFLVEQVIEQHNRDLP